MPELRYSQEWRDGAWRVIDRETDEAVDQYGRPIGRCVGTLSWSTEMGAIIIAGRLNKSARQE